MQYNRTQENSSILHALASWHNQAKHTHV